MKKLLLVLVLASGISNAKGLQAGGVDDAFYDSYSKRVQFNQSVQQMNLKKVENICINWQRNTSEGIKETQKI